jgi:hypothetical protein
MASFPTKWLRAQGLDLPEAELERLSEILESVLEMRVGSALYLHFSNEQIDEFEEIFERSDQLESDQDEALRWLEKNYPSYPNIVRYHKVKLSKEIRSAKDKLATINQLAV